jgi:hypothetical protein
MQIEIIAAIIIAVVGPMLLALVKKHWEVQNKKGYIIDSLEASMKIDEILISIKNNTKADRVWVTQFHNGGSFYPTGKSIAKFSVTYEEALPGSTILKDNFVNIPVTLFSKSLSFLYREGEILLPNYPETLGYGLHTFFDAYKTKSSYMFALKSIQGDFIGTLGVEYCNNIKNLSKDELGVLREQKVSLGTIIGEYLSK